MVGWPATMEPGEEFEEADATVQQELASEKTSRVRLRWTDETGPQEAWLEGSATLGSAVGVTVRLLHPTVSRLHARIEQRLDGPWLLDLESTNGTSVDGTRVTGALLRDGARLGLGHLMLEVHLERKKEKAELWSSERFGPLVGRSRAMRALFQRLSLIAPSDATVLISGETGTGKDVVARALHEASPRKNGPLVVVDCGAIPESLFESELFGHRKGAFTGAERAHHGAFEAARGGTLFLDEIGELPLSVQPKLLRVIETRTIRPVGETLHHPVDVRIVAASHRDLLQMVATGAFREDLYFRLAVLPLEVPPLRTRREDIDALVEHFLGGRTLPEDAMVQLRERPWLGNVRELRNFVERAAALGANEALRMSAPLERAAPDLPVVDVAEPFKEAKERWLAHLERSYLSKLLEDKRWNVSAVAEAMGLDRTYVHRLMRKHDLGR